MIPYITITKSFPEYADDPSKDFDWFLELVQSQPREALHGANMTLSTDEGWESQEL